MKTNLYICLTTLALLWRVGASAQTPQRELGLRTVNDTLFSGSSATIDSLQLIRTPVWSLPMTFSGTLSGLIANEVSSEPTRETYQFLVRGLSTPHGLAPLVIVDGYVCFPGTEQSALASLTPNEVSSVTVLKDASSQAVYGPLASHGVIVVKTRRGFVGKTRITGQVDLSVLERSVQPYRVSSVDYAMMRNQAAENDGLGKNYYFSDEQIARYQQGNDLFNYPNTNWSDLVLRKTTLMQRAAVDVQGGNGRVRYYTNINFMHTGGTYKAEDNAYRLKANVYNPNDNFMTFSFRSNVFAQLNQKLEATIHLAGNIKREHHPHGGYLTDIYPHLFTIPATVYGPLTPHDANANYPSGQVIVTRSENDSPYGMVNRTGFNDMTITNVYANMGLAYDLSSLLPGLKLSGNMGYKSYTVKDNIASTKYSRFIPNGIEPLDFIQQGSDENTPLTYSNGYDQFYDMAFRAAVSYERNFGKHYVNVFAHSMFQKAELNSHALPYKYIISAIDADYSFAQRYMARFVLGYSGSQQFAPNKRWFLTPAVSLGWNFGRESFLRSVKWLTAGKLRMSYGVVANDRAGLSRYAFDDYVQIDAGGPIGYYHYIYSEQATGNKNLAPERLRKLNVGLDLSIGRMVDFTADLYEERTDNLLINDLGNRFLFQGVPMKNYPKTNTGSYVNRGIELTLGVHKQVNRNFSFNVQGFFNQAVNKVLYSGEVGLGDDYLSPYREKGYAVGTRFGYLVDKSNGNGIYNFAEEIAQGPLYSFGTPRVGDLKYKDLNGDHMIDDKDKVAITRGWLPAFTYGANISLSYKQFDFSMLLQGVGKWEDYLDGLGMDEALYDGVFTKIHTQAWTQEKWNNDQPISYPALSTQSTTNRQPNNYFVVNRAFLRLKTIELAYRFRAQWMSAIKLTGLRLVLNAQNLITWHHLKKYGIGPEGTAVSVPMHKVFNIGVRASF